MPAEDERSPDPATLGDRLAARRRDAAFQARLRRLAAENERALERLDRSIAAGVDAAGEHREGRPLMSDRARFGFAIRFLRGERGLTQRELARAVGLNSKHLGDLERGRSDPRLTNNPGTDPRTRTRPRRIRRGIRM
jgi:DNA-binding XRE family transcriptional regulator